MSTTTMNNETSTAVPRTLLIETEEPIVVENYPTKAFVSEVVQQNEATVTTIDSTSLSTASSPFIVLVDPLSTGALLQRRLLEQSYRIILVWSDRTPLGARKKHEKNTVVEAVVHHDKNNMDQTVSAILAVSQNIHAILCGAEYGVMLEDALANALNKALGTTHLRSSGMPDVRVKVDKHQQASILRSKKLNAVQEVLIESEEELETFLETHDDSHSMVVKPQTGAGSVGVQFCHGNQEIRKAYHAIRAGHHKSKYSNKYKHYDDCGVLLQEFLQGTEYIVNVVVSNGTPKTTALWKYDKRPYNGASFVCFSKELLADPDSPVLNSIMDYAEQVIEALEFRNGALHIEIMHDGVKPTLVEMNCRLHGGHGHWVKPAEVCLGYSQVGVFMDAYLNEGNGDFADIPVRPVHAKQWSHQVKLRSRITGTMKGTIDSQMERITSLPSYYEHYVSVKKGERLLRTIDMASVPGEVTLIHSNKEQLDADYNLLNEILHEGIFEVEQE